MKENETVKVPPFFGIPKIKEYFKPYHKKMIIAFVLLCLTSGISTVVPVFNRYAIDNFVGKRSLEGLLPFAVLYFIVITVQLLSHIFAGYINLLVDIALIRDLRSAAFKKLQTLSFSYYNRNNTGSIHARIVSDIGNLCDAVCWCSFAITWDVIYILMAFVIMFTMNPGLAFLLLAFVPVAAFVIYKFQARLLSLGREVREINSVITGNFNEVIMGAKDVKALVAEEKMNEKFRSNTLRMRAKATHLGHISALSSSFIVFLSSITLALVLMQGGRLTKDGIIMIGSLSVFMSYATEIAFRIRAITGELSYLIKSSANIERFDALMKEESEVADSPEVIEKYGDIFHPKKENWEELHGDVTFRDVTFKYPDGEEYVLEHFNLSVPQGTNVAIVGETGAGKSTLVNLVCRFFEPTEGEILIDGRNVKERSSLWLHNNIGYVLQSPHLFSGSIRDNLKYGKPDATDPEIMEALRLVSAVDLIEKLEHGLDSNVGEGGDLLSTGEKQLLSFARAIISDPKILILDEATSSIDTMTEKLIQDAIDTVIKGRTSFVIAHRLSTIVNADVILVVRDGKIIESGKHKELMEKEGYYYSLFTKQFEESAMEKVF